jgi:regulator of protease activity HflC (stomatin/prohibitin superfamily)
MKKLFQIILIILTFVSCTLVTPKAGEEAVIVKQPAFFGNGGVITEPISTGSKWIAITSMYKIFKITPETYTEEFKDMIPSDNTPVSFNAYAKVQIRKGYTPELYQKFGETWYESSVREAFRTMVRIHASKFKMFELASKREVTITIQDTLLKELSNYTKKLNIPVDILQIIIGSITPPEQVLTETKNTAAQNQSVLTQKARADAELSRKQAEINKAIADKAYQNQMSMSIDQYLHLRQLEIEKEKVELIKDKTNVTIIFGQSTPLTYPIK